MKKYYFIFFSLFIILISFAAGSAVGQEIKAPSGVSRPYPGMGVDMQYYEIRYDPNSDEHVGYYKVIREKIMRKLKGMYTGRYRNGDVCLLFTVKSDGKLAAYDIDYDKSVKDRALLDIVTTGLKSSAPFPAFPKGLDQPYISFNVVISFKEE